MARRTQERLQGAAKKLVQNLMERISESTRIARAGKVTYLIGNNGTGKSRILGELATRLAEEQPRRTVACIASSLHDRFTYGDHGKVRYLGARNATNAVFQAAVERQLSKFILQAMLADRRRFKRLLHTTGMALTFELGGESIERLRPSTPSEARAARQLRKRAEKRDLLAARPLATLRRIAEGTGKFEQLRGSQLEVLLQYLELNIEISVSVQLANGRSIRFTDLSTGEQNRTLLFAKVLSVMEEGAVFLIDEPEISLHLHWQMELHENLMNLLSDLTRYHVVIATHAPIIVSEAARFDEASEVNMVAVLRREPIDGTSVFDGAPGSVTLEPQFHSFAEVASHEQLILRYFQTAPYHTREVSVEIADTVLRVAEDRAADSEALKVLRELRSTKGLPEQACEQIDAAIDIIERDMVTSIRGEPS